MTCNCNCNCGCQDCGCGTKHPDHSGELSRLNRVAGQIEGVKKMIAERRYCPEIMTQLRAARAALKTIEGGMLETHLASCVATAMRMGDADAKIGEIVEIFKRYED